MPKTKHEQEFAIDLARRGDEVRQQFGDLLRGSSTQFNDFFNNFLLPQLTSLMGEDGDLNKALERLSQIPELKGLTDISGELPGLTDEGLSQEALSALRGQQLDRQSRGFDDASARLRNELARRGIFGGGGPGSGLAANPLAMLAAQKEIARSEALRNVTLANEQQRFLNRRDLSLPMRQQELARRGLIAQTELGARGQDLARSGLISDQELGARQQELQRRNLLLGGLQGAGNIFGTIGQTFNPFTTGILGGLNAFQGGVNARINARLGDKGPLSDLLPTLIGAGLSFIPKP